MAVIGIDLGTSNSAAVLRGGRPVMVPGPSVPCPAVRR
jgi:molecular chaperone DnaK (HSP70)